MEPLEQWNMIKDQVEEAITKEPSTNEKVAIRISDAELYFYY